MIMKLMVTGGAGFIGSNFIHYILNTYDDIEIINNEDVDLHGAGPPVEEAEDAVLSGVDPCHVVGPRHR